jgi:predicted CoA-substrate-specific enzyme activase
LPQAQPAAGGSSGAIIGADVVKNEITAHAAATRRMIPCVRTILEIGGQDSKIILIKSGVVYDFAMNTVCAAGTGSFLDRQAAKLNIPIEEFGSYALRSRSPVRIAGRCAVFAESDMIHKQQTGCSVEDIICGLCQALVRNYLSNLAKGKRIEEPVVFQGGVAANAGIAAAFESALGFKIIIPEHYDVMGAYGAALLALKRASSENAPTRFYGYGASQRSFKSGGFECDGCPNLCEIVEITADGELVARWGGRCGRWEQGTRQPVQKANA